MGVCAAPAFFDLMRVTRLASSGSPEPGDESIYVSDKGISFGVAVESEQGQQIQRRLGNGAFCLDFRDCDRVTGVTLTTALCNLDFEQLEIMTAGHLWTEEFEGNEIPIGYGLPALDEACPNGVGVEAWVRALAGSQQINHPISGLPAWFRFVVPKVTWTIDGELSFGGEDSTDTTLRGVGSSNTNWGTGVAADHPDIGARPMAIFLDDETNLPEAACEYQALAS